MSPDDGTPARPETIGDRVRLALEQRIGTGEGQINQSELARRGGPPQSVTSQILRGGIREPSAAQVAAVAKGLGVSAAWLLLGETDDAPAYDRGKLEGWRLALRWVQGWSEAAERAGPSLATTPAELSAGRSSGEVKLEDAGMYQHFAEAVRRPESPSARTAGPADAGTAPPTTPAQTTPKRGKRAG